MSKQVTFGINYRLQSYDKVNFDETVYMGKIAGSSFFLKEIPDSVILTREELNDLRREIAADAFEAGSWYGLQEFEAELGWIEKIEAPDKEQYLSSLNTKENV